MQFRILHLLIGMTLVAIDFGLFRFSPGVAASALPAFVGPALGFVVSRSLEGILLGLISAYFWCLVGAVISMIVAVAGAAFLSGVEAPDAWINTWMLTVAGLHIVTCSTIGGYVGGRIATS